MATSTGARRLQIIQSILLAVALTACQSQPATGVPPAASPAQTSAAVSVTATSPPAAMATAQPATATAMPAAATPGRSPRPEVMADGMLNLAHLNFLSEVVAIDAQPTLITHIYSEAPRYEWVDASGEGIAALDDVARATIVYLDFFTRTHDGRALERARAGLNFALRLQADDGEFYNFIIDRAGKINTTGNTSYKSLGWWAYRGAWALARGYAVFKAIDPTYAARLQTAYLKTEGRIRARLQHVGQTTSVHGFTLPAWIPDGAADATGVAVLALADYQAAAPNDATRQLLTSLADGLRDYQLGGPGEYPWAMHPHTLTAPGFWHAWGAHEAQALARAGMVLKRDDYIAGAKRELDTFFAWQLATERIQEMGVLPFKQGQQAYGTNSIVQAAMNVFQATGDARYARMGGLHASWFMGNNWARTPMYDPQTGRGYDGIDRELAVNLNAGAESTIESLMALQAVLAVPMAAKYLDYTTQEQQSWSVLEAEDGKEIAGTPSFRRGDWTGEARYSGGRYYELNADDAVDLTFDVARAGSYLLYVAGLRRATTAQTLSVQAVKAPGPIAVDGKPTEWADVPVVAADTAKQFVRGAQTWRGPETDSFKLRLMWDAQQLYVLAEVRDPQHEQTGHGAGVGSGDALWLYLDTEGTGNRIAAKVTLAQTPAGPEVWDWKAGFPLPGARLAWLPAAGGYTYEAALPWESLRARGVQTGKRLRIEAGRGVGGNAFLDLSGADPDSAANLVAMQLVEQGAQTATAAAAPSDAAQAPAAASVALGVQLDGGERWTVPQAVSPDRDYLWLDRVGAQPISLTAGKHTLRLSYAGSDAQRSTVVDGFLLHPTLATKTLAGRDGSTLRLTFDLAKGMLTWQE